MHCSPKGANLSSRKRLQFYVLAILDDLLIEQSVMVFEAKKAVNCARVESIIYAGNMFLTAKKNNVI